ncbi:splicing factor Cactin-like [Coffea arabica]|uniref:Splicing factor Cactin n=1 Tax=Coffea arabica TaxID=13443 RepID=A0A6P6T583_COFAR|nr:cactin-like [Coffea arabica]
MERRMERLGQSQQCPTTPYTSDDECHNMRIADYLARKVEKKRAKVAREWRSKYSVDGSSKRFGDSHINEVFVWRKKIERDVMEGRIEGNMLSSKAERKRQMERFGEVEKLKKRREERDIAKRKREEEMALLARERARSEVQEWEKKEEEFLLAQRKIRTEKRFCEGRPKPIDILIRLIDSCSNDDDLEKDKNAEPSMVAFEGLNVEELEKLREETKLQLCLDRKTKMHVEYWETVLVVCEDALDHARVCGERGIHRSIEADVERFLEGKSYNQLEDIESHIESNMRSGNAQEVEFWEAVLKRLCVFKAKARLKSIHAKVLHDRGHIQQNKKPLEVGDGSTDGQSSSELDEEALGSYPPELMIYDDDDENGEAIDTKYFTRKPKYFNLVHTGYRWNKYNQTHYDHDNPPPKMVVGYKFNIFYPDLLDKARAPTYLIEKDADRNDTCIVRFRAGPPYQDIAFRIANKEWEYSRKKGFKCNFEGGILRLYFNIKSYSYRR